MEENVTKGKFLFSKAIYNLIICAIWTFSLKVYSIFEGSLESAIAVMQVQDDSIIYSLSRHISGGAIPSSISTLFSIILIIYLYKSYNQYNQNFQIIEETKNEKN